jgi:ribosomal protein S18 acetylase RimI-like enzyme
MTITIQPLQDHDISAVTDLWRAAGLAHPWNDSARDIRLALAHPTNRILIAHEADADASARGVVGAIMAGFDGHRGWLYSLAVDDAVRGQGVGRRLMDAAEAWLAERGAPVVRLLVEGSNAKVAAFYERCGYDRGDFIAFGKRLAGTTVEA